MKQSCILFAILMLCSALLGCQPTTDGSGLFANNRSIQVPSNRATDPIVDPTTVPTEPPTEPTVSEPLPTEPLLIGR